MHASNARAGGKSMQKDLAHDPYELTDEQVHWLRALMKRRPADDFVLPDSIHQVLAEKHLAQWSKGAVSITFEGIREAVRRR